MKKSKFFGNLPGRKWLFFIRIHDPQISNQIDVAVSICTSGSNEQPGKCFDLATALQP